MAGLTEELAGRIPEHLPAAEDWDAYQLVELAGRLAERGVEPARQALEDALAADDLAIAEAAAGYLMRLDGLDGLLRAAAFFGGRLLAEPETPIDDDLLTEAEGHFGEDVLQAIEGRARFDHAVRAWLDASLAARQEREEREPTPRPTLADAIRDPRLTEGWHPLRFGFLARTASEEDLEVAFRRLLFETRRDPLRRWLALFREVTLPRLDDRLFDLAVSDDQEVRWAAVRALANVRAPEVREFALRLLRERGPEVLLDSEAARLFTASYEPGDHEALEAALPAEAEVNHLHGVSQDLLQVAQAQSDPELAGCLRWVYEHSPCSLCREQAVRELLERERAPEDLLRECLHDVSAETRKMAEVALGLPDEE